MRVYTTRRSIDLHRPQQCSSPSSLAMGSASSEFTLSPRCIVISLNPGNWLFVECRRPFTRESNLGADVAHWVSVQSGTCPFQVMSVRSLTGRYGLLHPAPFGLLTLCRADDKHLDQGLRPNSRRALSSSRSVRYLLWPFSTRRWWNACSPRPCDGSPWSIVIDEHSAEWTVDPAFFAQEI